MTTLERVKALLVEALALLSQEGEARGKEEFLGRVSQVLEARWPDHDFTPERLEELYRLAQGDAATVGSFLARCAYRRAGGWSPDSLAGYVLSTIRKVGIEALRAEREERRKRRQAAEPAPAPEVPAEDAAPDQDPVDELLALLRDGGS